MTELLQGHHQIVNAQPAGHWSPLHYAAAAEALDAVQSLLWARAGARLRTLDGRAAFDVAFAIITFCALSFVLAVLAES